MHAKPSSTTTESISVYHVGLPWVNSSHEHECHAGQPNERKWTKIWVSPYHRSNGQQVEGYFRFIRTRPKARKRAGSSRI